MTVAISRRRWPVTRSCMSHGSMQRPIANGRASDCLRRQSGRRPPGARMADLSLGESTGRIEPGQLRPNRDCRDPCATGRSDCCSIRRSSPWTNMKTRSVPMASIRWPAMWLNGQPIGTTRNITRRRRTEIPRGRKRGTQKAFRGGGWIDSTPSVRPAQRNGTDPKTKMNWLGFRCARDVKEAGRSRQETREPNAAIASR